MGSEGGGECKFQYELITLSQPAYKARGGVSSEDKPEKCVDPLSYKVRSGRRRWGFLSSYQRIHMAVSLVISRTLGLGK